MAGRIILEIAYGIDVLPQNDPYVATAEKTLHAISLATNMSGTLFDLIPWRRSPLLPSPLPSRTALATWM
jgi:hypothetical protein